jgi:hypothetical protein
VAFAVSNVVYFPGAEYTTEPMDPKIVLRAALEYGELEDVVLIGHRTDGAVYAASSIADGADILWLLELLKLHILPKPVSGE